MGLFSFAFLTSEERRRLFLVLLLIANHNADLLPALVVDDYLERNFIL
jgi:hypothetical protein